jgi:hypothetical protein
LNVGTTAKTVNGSFFQAHTITVSSITGNGSVFSNEGGLTPINCPATSCSKAYPESGTVVLTANNDFGWNFTTWGGDCSGSSIQCTFTNLSSAKNVTATFSLIAPVLPPADDDGDDAVKPPKCKKGQKLVRGKCVKKKKKKKKR